MLITSWGFASDSRHCKTHFFPFLTFSPNNLEGGGMETQSCQSPLSGPIFKVSETLSHLDMWPGRKLSCDLSLTFHSTHSYHPGPCYLRSPCDESMKKQMPPVTPVPCSPSLPPRTQPCYSSGWSWQASFLLDGSRGFVIKTTTPALPFAFPSLLLFFQSHSSSPLLLLICSGNTWRLANPKLSPMLSISYKCTKVYFYLQEVLIMTTKELEQIQQKLKVARNRWTACWAKLENPRPLRNGGPDVFFEWGCPN